MIYASLDNQQIYLGTRYTCLLGWIIFFIVEDSSAPKIPCKVRFACFLIIATYLYLVQPLIIANIVRTQRSRVPARLPINAILTIHAGFNGC